MNVKSYIMFGIAPLLAITIIVTLKMMDQIMPAEMQQDKFIGVERMPAMDINATGEIATFAKVESNDTFTNAKFILPYVMSLITATIAFIIIKKLS